MKRILLCALGFVCVTIFAQEAPSTKFGKIKPEDFQLPAGKLTDSSASVIILDQGNTVFAANPDGGFAMKFTRQMRARINTAAGVDVADFQIPLYGERGDRETLFVKFANAYNLVDGKVVETQFDRKQVFDEKLRDNLVLSKFSIPGVKPGAIIEVEYTVFSKYLTNLQPWEFQGEYPRLWSTYEVGIPEYFNYAFLSQGYLSFHEKSQKQQRVSFYLTFPAQNAGERPYNGNLDVIVNTGKWTMKDVPALKEEAFTTSLDNHIAKIEFQLNEVLWPNQPIQRILGSWSDLNKRLNESESFGANLYKGNGFLDDELKIAAGNATDPNDKAKAVYNYVRDNYTCTQFGGLYMQQTLKETIKKKAGTVADINLLLTSLLNRAGIKAHPVILSKRSRGYTNSMYPLIDRFNYVIAAVQMDGDENMNLLDASTPQLTFGKIPLECYNGHVRIITPDEALAAELEANLVHETKVTTLFASYADKEWKATVTSKLGYYESLDAHTSFKKDGKKSLVEQMRKQFPDDLVQGEIELENLGKIDTAVVCSAKLDYSSSLEEDIIYLNPIPGGVIKDNPFNATERLYPVEMPYAFDETYAANWQLPDGYTIDEVPKSTRIKLFEDSGMFEYLIQASGNRVMLRTRLKIDTTNFAPEEYAQLKEFFDYVINKENEQVVLKRNAKP